MAHKSFVRQKIGLGPEPSSFPGAADEEVTTHHHASIPIGLAQTAIQDPRCATPNDCASGCKTTEAGYLQCLRCPQIRRRGDGTSKSPVPVGDSENHGKPQVT